MLWKGFQKPKRLAVDQSTLTDKYGIFWAQPFERGFGTTVGNALRRVLLSSIEGAAVTAVKMEGVLHEFQSIPGVVEDATDIILNLKQIPFKLAGDAFDGARVEAASNVPSAVAGTFRSTFGAGPSIETSTWVPAGTVYCWSLLTRAMPANFTVSPLL